MSGGTQRPEAMIGQVIAGYQLNSFIGAGATGLVFEGKRVAAPAVVEKTGVAPVEFPDVAAVKLLVPPLGSSQDELDEFQRRFLREARTLKALDHPNILPLIDFGEDTDAGYFYMLLPFMAGGSLATAIASRGAFPLDEAAAILTKVGAALDYAHAQGVIHRDVKPGNILLDAAGEPELCDFSIVRVLTESTTMRTTTGRMMGTPAYMAPEQFDDSSKVGAAADIYGLGMVAYELALGRAAFGGTSWAQVMKQQIADLPTLPRVVRPDIPEPVEAAIMRALAKDPAGRFPTASAFAQAFTLGAQGQWASGLTAFIPPSAVAGFGGATTAPIGAYGAPPVTPPAAPRRSGARMGLLGAAAALLLVVACIAGLFATSQNDPFWGRFLAAATSTGTASATVATQTDATVISGGSPTATAKAGSNGTTGGAGSGGGGGGPSTPTATTGLPVALYGDGSDGSLSISGSVTDSSPDASCTGTAGSTSLFFTGGTSSLGAASGKPVLIHQSQGTGAGTWMRNSVVSVSGAYSGTLMLQSPLNATYTTGAQVILLRQYATVIVSAGSSWLAPAWNGSTGGILAFLANGTVSIGGSVVADGWDGSGSSPSHTNGGGFRGGQYVGTNTHQAGFQGEGTVGDGSRNTASNGNGGGAGGYSSSDNNQAAGGGGSNGTQGTSGSNYGNAAGGTTGAVSGTSDLSNMTFGGGGGSGGSSDNSGGGVGGNGGGIVFIVAVQVSLTGAISARGGNGGPNVVGNNSPGGGGGAGGSVYIKAQSASVNTNLINVSGGTGGGSSGSHGPGGNGGSGRIFIG